MVEPTQNGRERYRRKLGELGDSGDRIRSFADVEGDQHIERRFSREIVAKQFKAALSQTSAKRARASSSLRPSVPRLRSSPRSSVWVRTASTLCAASTSSAATQKMCRLSF